MSFKSSFVVLLLGLCTHLAASSPTPGRYDYGERVQQCREGCLGKFASTEALCVLNSQCSPCWEVCAMRVQPKINKPLRETWSLRTVSMLLQDSLVLVDVAWDPLNTPYQCLVTWEVSGGGLMGNLLTESSNVQLSLWPDTKYRVQVTCKNKEPLCPEKHHRSSVSCRYKLSDLMTRSLPLTIDTSEATVSQVRNQQPSQKTTLMPTSTAVQHSNTVQETVPSSITNSGGVPFDDQSSESINQHTNFIFNWHQKNSDISKIEPLSKPDLNILRITSLSEMQNPLLFDMIAGSIILIVILFLYMCILRNHRRSSDKIALIEDDSHSYLGVSIPVAAAVQSNSSATTSSIAPPELCKNPTICSRTALKV